MCRFEILQNQIDKPNMFHPLTACSRINSSMAWIDETDGAKLHLLHCHFYMVKSFGKGWELNDKNCQAEYSLILDIRHEPKEALP